MSDNKISAIGGDKVTKADAIEQLMDPNTKAFMMVVYTHDGFVSSTWPAGITTSEMALGAMKLFTDVQNFLKTGREDG